MRLAISKDRTISDVQRDFNGQYPFLKLEFYKIQKSDPSQLIKKYLPGSMLFKAAGIGKDGILEIKDEMKVSELEKIFFQRFGLRSRVSRKSGMIWLETTMTDNWSLAKQNEYGREITVESKIILPDESVGENK